MATLHFPNLNVRTDCLGMKGSKCSEGHLAIVLSKRNFFTCSNIIWACRLCCIPHQLLQECQINAESVGHAQPFKFEQPSY
jgi:hypothetical protein